ncbi:MAG: glycoside hydrolase/phage tail family protein, partial [Rhizobiaceae bacterium]|nr:glycoside hydrolase/phage tail family protein [Rhizobiaceae bacterium]
IPQFQFEVMRPVGALNPRIRAVALLPGSTEYGLSPDVVTREVTPGETVAENRHVLHAGSDLRASLDELQALCPNVERVALVVSWFGNDLRAGDCSVRPMVAGSDGEGLSQAWTVSGIGRDEAAVVSTHGGHPAFGGTPSDRSVLDAIAEITGRGLAVTLYPFLMMDIAASNFVPDPYTGVSPAPAYPWRGRITCWPGPQLAETADKTAAARAQVDAFCGPATAADFSTGDGTVVFGGSGWGYRRLVLHYAKLAAMAGGVDAFVIGSELRGLTTLRDGDGAFPFVEQLCDLTAEARTILGAGCKITYAADWSEYFGHQPADGSGDVLFHLDPLWAHPDIDAVGIDNYMPLADWRDSDALGEGPDGARGPHDAEALRGGIAGGEGFDWYYASDADRAARVRSPIADGAYGRHWVFRYKDLVGWWSNQHFDRPGGIESATPTAWVPGGKPIWLTELGCPAVDRGPNQPNVFPDAKSSEGAVPHFSTGGRSDAALFAFGLAHVDHWDGQADSFDAAANPVSGVYDGRMVDPDRLYFWAWDARPFPAFPNRGDVWGDGANWIAGHWLTGRIEGAPVGDVVDAILADHGLPAADTAGAGGTVHGYVLSEATTARGALEPLVDLFGLAVGETGDRLAFADEGASGTRPVEIDEFALPDGGDAVVTRIRAADLDLPAEAVLSFHDPMRDYQQATARTVVDETGGGGIGRTGFPGTLDTGLAKSLLDDWARRKAAAREQVRFAVDQSRIDVAPGRLVRLSDEAASGTYLVTDVEGAISRTVGARRLAAGRPAAWAGGLGELRPIRATRAGPPLAHLLDLPMIGDAEPHEQLRVALRAKPWLAHATYASPSTSGFTQRASVRLEATVGLLSLALAPGFEGRLDKAGTLTVDLWSGALASVPDIQLLAGANRAAVRAGNGDWEVLQFGQAEEIEPGRWQLSRLLRGQCGTRLAMLAGAAEQADFVLLDAAVVAAGLWKEEIGRVRNWRIGPVGHDFAGPTFWQGSATGGVRAIRPLPPAHLVAARQPGGDRAIRWIRRGRIDADRGLASDVPLGEEIERYELVVSNGAMPVRSQTLSAPDWIYPAASIAADFPAPATATVTVRQVSVAAGAGDPAVTTFFVP